MSISIESDLKEILERIEKRFDKVDEKFEELGKTVNDMNLRLTKVETKLDSELPTLQKGVDEIKGSQKAQIWTLIGILITAVTGFLLAVGKFVISGNP
jgi:tetrahydromethanopterin S-methyltransferase subunit B